MASYRTGRHVAGLQVALVLRHVMSSSGVPKCPQRPLKKRPVRCLETSGTNYAATRHRMPQQWIPHSHGCHDLKNSVQQPKEQCEFLCVGQKSKNITAALWGDSTRHQVLLKSSYQDRCCKRDTKREGGRWGVPDSVECTALDMLMTAHLVHRNLSVCYRN
jgi:hypothetical protein